MTHGEQGWEFALSLLSLFLERRKWFAHVALLKRATRAKLADCSFHFFVHKSDLLFLRMGKLNTGIKNVFHTFWLCFYEKRANALHKKRVKSDLLFFKERCARKTKEWWCEGSWKCGVHSEVVFLEEMWQLTADVAGQCYSICGLWRLIHC